MSVVEKIYFYVAIAASVLLLLQFLLLVFGIGDSDGGDMDISDTGSDSTDFDGDGGMRFISMRGIVAFFCIGGWSGYGLATSSIHLAWTVILSLLFGLIALFGVAYLFALISKLQYDGTMNLKNGIGKIAEVYLPIGANGAKIGKITLDVQGRFTEAEAVTQSDRDLKVGERVKVVGMQSGTIYVVKPYTPAKED